MGQAHIASSTFGSDNHQAGLTAYIAPGQSRLRVTFDGGGTGIPELNAKIPLLSDGVFSFMEAVVPFNNLNATTTLTFRNNGADGNQTFSIGSSTSGTFTDSSNTDSVTAGNFYAVKIAAGGSGGSCHFSSLGVIWKPTTGHNVPIASVDQNTTGPGSSPNYNSWSGTMGQNDGTLDQVKIKASCTAKNAFVFIYSSSATVVATYTNYINGSPGNIVISQTAGTTGLYQDTTHNDSLAVDDKIICHVTLAGGSFPSVAVEHLGLWLDYTSGQKADMQACRPENFSAVSNGATYFQAAGGQQNGTGTSTESDVQQRTHFSSKWSNLWCQIQTNSDTNPSTLKSRVATADGNQSVSITASTTGFFEDTTNSDTLGATDLIALKATTSIAGTLTFTTIGSLLEDLAAVPRPRRSMVLAPG